MDDDGVGGEGRDLDLAGSVPEAQRPNAAPTLAVAGGNGLDGGDLGEVVHGHVSFAGAVVRRHPVTVSFVGKHMLRILRPGWASEKRFAYPAVLQRALSGPSMMRSVRSVSLDTFRRPFII